MTQARTTEGTAPAKQGGEPAPVAQQQGDETQQDGNVHAGNRHDVGNAGHGEIVFLGIGKAAAVAGQQSCDKRRGVLGKDRPDLILEEPPQPQGKRAQGLPALLHGQRAAADAAHKAHADGAVIEIVVFRSAEFGGKGHSVPRADGGFVGKVQKHPRPAAFDHGVGIDALTVVRGLGVVPGDGLGGDRPAGEVTDRRGEEQIIGREPAKARSQAQRRQGGDRPAAFRKQEDAERQHAYGSRDKAPGRFYQPGADRQRGEESQREPAELSHFISKWRWSRRPRPRRTRPGGIP